MADPTPIKVKWRGVHIGRLLAFGLLTVGRFTDIAIAIKSKMWFIPLKR